MSNASNHETPSSLNAEHLRSRVAAVLSIGATAIGGFVVATEEKANAESIVHESVKVNTTSVCETNPDTGNINALSLMQAHNRREKPIIMKLSVTYEDEPLKEEMNPGTLIEHEGYSGQMSIPSGKGEYAFDVDRDGNFDHSGTLSYEGITCDENGNEIENPDNGGGDNEEEPGVGGGTIDTSNACPPEEVPDGDYADVGEPNVHKDMIDCVTWYEVAHGITEHTYAPAGQVTRGQMGSFIARSMTATDIEMPQPSDQGFTDTEGSVHEDRINQLAELGVVRGVDSETYAPRIPVTRAQMASFLVRAYEKVTGIKLGATSDHFDDDNGNTHEPKINAAAEAGLTAGTTLETYEPDKPVRRDQMASFLSRLLELMHREGHVTRPDESSS